MTNNEVKRLPAERKWNPEKYQWEDVQPEVQAVPEPTVYETPPSPTPTEPTIEEHASMLRQGFEKLVNKAVEGTELAKRVQQLEALCNGMEAQLHGLASDLATEERNHEDTQKRLQEVQSELARRESTVHDLVIERDIVIGERNAAQAERDDARNEVKRLQSDVDFLNQRVIDQAHANEVLSERSEMLTRKIATIKAAFAALNE